MSGNSSRGGDGAAWVGRRKLTMSMSPSHAFHLTGRARSYDVAATAEPCHKTGERTVPKPPSPSFQDPLTGLSNREHFEVLYDFAFPVADRGIPLTVVYLELDGLADLRARAGESAEREAVGAFGRRLLGTTRSMDVAA